METKKEQENKLVNKPGSELYKERVDYICSIPRFTRKAKLENTGLLLAELGDPQRKVKSVHVAGTNGKGSVSKMMAGLLERSGFKTGLFISPHLVRINERFAIDGKPISEGVFVEVFIETLRRTVDSNLLKAFD